MTLSIVRSPTAAGWIGDVSEVLTAAARYERDPGERAAAVATALHGQLPSPEILSPEQREGAPDHYQQHILYVDPAGDFSVMVLVWRPGQSTPIHDHVCWCTVGVLAGVEHEIRYTLGSAYSPSVLVEQGQLSSAAGDISAFAPPGDIHQVSNSGGDVAISLHIYGADISAAGSSIRRVYPQPLLRVPA